MCIQKFIRTFKLSKGHDDDTIHEYDAHFITEVSSPVDINLVEAAVAPDLTINKLKEIIYSGWPPYRK